jgi:hypothetical protein
MAGMFEKECKGPSPNDLIEYRFLTAKLENRCIAKR